MYGSPLVLALDHKYTERSLGASECVMSAIEKRIRTAG